MNPAFHKLISLSANQSSAACARFSAEAMLPRGAEFLPDASSVDKEQSSALFARAWVDIRSSNWAAACDQYPSSQTIELDTEWYTHECRTSGARFQLV